MTTKSQYSIIGVCVRPTSTIHGCVKHKMFLSLRENNGLPRFKLLVRIQGFKGFKMYHWYFTKLQETKKN